MSKGSGGKHYGVVSGDQQRTMSGLEFVQGLVTGTLPMNSMAERSATTLSRSPAAVRP
jgi:hypothetical protein